MKAIPRLDELAPLVLFDGICGLCNRTVQFVLPRSQEVRFAPLQTQLARQILEGTSLSATQLDTVVLLDHAGLHTESTAALRLMRHLSGWWPLLSIFLWVPRPLRDAVYRWVARNRYHWFGKLESCRLPSPEEASRFVA